jgi:glycosyltransferase involved in cell wall biosynthesis
MKLLIITQKVDRKDPILGFFHRWVAEFARQCDQATVVGQMVGEHEFVKNVQVESLGKESGRNKVAQVLHFWRLCFGLRSQYDAVLVHMTPIWMVLGAPLWILLRKRRYLWYEARGTRWPLRIALRAVQKVFSASVHGMPLRSQKSVVVGHGIDTDFFAPGKEERDPYLLLTVGRITQSKHLPAILAAFKQLPKEFTLMMVGRPLTKEDDELAASLQEEIAKGNLQNRVSMQPVTQDALLPLLQRASIFVHASSTSLDKAVLEALSTGCVVISTAEAVQPLLLPDCQATEQTLAARIQDIAGLSAKDREDIAYRQREIIQRDHSLSRLVQRLTAEMVSTS